MGGADDDNAAAMAAALGFSSFGAQNKGAKRRKFNPRVDDAVTNSSSLSLHHNNFKAAASGSNITPLGERTNKDEDTADDRAPLGHDGAGETADRIDDDTKEVRASLRQNDDENQDPAPQYIDTSRPATMSDEVQSRIDAIAAASLAQAEPTALSERQEGFGARGGRRGFQGDRGQMIVVDKPWWDDYYDLACNVNPWENLELLAGLESRGTWLSYDESKARWEEVQASRTAKTSAGGCLGWT